MIPIEDLTDVTLAIKDTDEDDEEDLTDVTLVSDDTYWSWWKLSNDGTSRIPLSTAARLLPLMQQIVLRAILQKNLNIFSL